MQLGGTHNAVRQRTLWLVLLLAALFCRGFIADGFMPDFSVAKAPRMAICYGGMDMDRPAPVKQDQNHHNAAPCPYMALASHTPVAPIIIAAAVPDVSPFQAPLPARFLVSPHKNNVGPRGPPAFS